MNALASVGVIVGVAVLTPGPNNVIVFQRGLAGGLRAAAPAITAILLGVMIQTTVAGQAIAMLSAHAWVLRALVFSGSCYLVWIGANLIRQAWRETAPGLPPPQFTSWHSVLLFQFVNPKAWTTVLTAVAAVQAAQLSHAQAWVLGLYLSLSLPALLLWAVLGRRVAGWLAESAARRRFDFAMGLLLGFCALQLVWQ